MSRSFNETNTSTSPFINLSPILEAIKGHEEDLAPLSLQSGTYIYERRSINSPLGNTNTFKSLFHGIINK